MFTFRWLCVERLHGIVMCVRVCLERVFCDVFRKKMAVATAGR